MFKQPFCDEEVSIVSKALEEFKIRRGNICCTVKLEKKTNKRNNTRIKTTVLTIQEPKMQRKEIL